MINRDRELLRQMSYFFQWVYWRSSDPQADAIRGRRTDATPVDMLKALGAMRKKLKLALGEDVISAAGDGWFLALQHRVFEDMPVLRSRVHGRAARQ